MLYDDVYMNDVKAVRAVIVEHLGGNEDDARAMHAAVIVILCMCYDD